MTTSILVAYATQHGSTCDVADAIAEALQSHFGLRVDVLAVDEVQTVAGYDAVILGSPVINDEWLPAAGQFLETFAKALRDLPRAYFLTCMSMEKHRDLDGADAVALYRQHLEDQALPPTLTGIFPGELCAEDLSNVEDYLRKSRHLPAGDHRDWVAVRDWAIAAGQALIQLSQSQPNSG